MEIFTDEYVNQEVAFMDIADKQVDVEGATTSTVTIPFGRLDDYLNVNFRADPLTFPVYCLDDYLTLNVSSEEN